MKKNLSTIVLATMFTACSVQPPEDKKKDAPDQTTAGTTTPHVANPTKDICSYNKDPDKGCLKAAISGSELTIGEFSYEIGVKAFARTFNSDLAVSNEVEMVKGTTLEFSQRVTVQNFYSNFAISIEGSHTVYSAVSMGLGNLQVNEMSPGSYSILVSKDFDLKVMSGSTVVGNKCAIVWARRSVEIAAGHETPLTEAISEFELQIFDTSCSGSKVRIAVPTVVVLPSVPTAE